MWRRRDETRPTLPGKIPSSSVFVLTSSLDVRSLSRVPCSIKQSAGSFAGHIPQNIGGPGLDLNSQRFVLVITCIVSKRRNYLDRKCKSRLSQTRCIVLRAEFFRGVGF